MGDVVGSGFGTGQGVARAASGSAWREQLRQVQDALSACALEIEREVTLKATAELAGTLSRAARRLRSAEGSSWHGVLLEAVHGFASRAALFTIHKEMLSLEGVRGLPGTASLRDIPIAQAPAFRAAVESGDTIVAMRTKGELSEPIAAHF